MTGFARVMAPSGLTWELRSVNGKGLDVRLRLPPSCEGIETLARDCIAKRLSRGSVTATLSLGREIDPPFGVSVNQVLLDQLMLLAADLPQHIAPPSFDGLLAVRGVLTSGEEGVLSDEDRIAREAAALALLAEAVEALVATRAEEGQRLAVVLEAQLDAVEVLVLKAATRAAQRSQTAGERLRGQVAELLQQATPVSEDRLAQEIALLVVRQDVREEIDRLLAHIAQARDLLSHHKAPGRRLDFLCQEFNREANTLCSKAQDAELTHLGLDLKVIIDQIREQVQNIE